MLCLMFYNLNFPGLFKSVWLDYQLLMDVYLEGLWLSVKYFEERIPALCHTWMSQNVFLWACLIWAQREECHLLNGHHQVEQPQVFLWELICLWETRLSFIGGFDKILVPSGIVACLILIMFLNRKPKHMMKN